MKKYEGRWIDNFIPEIYQGNEKHRKGKIILQTPCIDYYFTREQWREFKEKVNRL